MSFDLVDGRIDSLAGNSCRSMVVQEYALVVGVFVLIGESILTDSWQNLLRSQKWHT